MKKAILVLGLLMSILFFVGCSDKDDEKEGYVGEHSNFANENVTNKNLREFINAFETALWGYDDYRSTRGKRNTQNFNETENGRVSGKMVYSGSYTEIETDDGDFWEENMKVTLSDYSNGSDLFLGGSFTLRFAEYESPDNEILETELNGNIEFRGRFSGTLVFDNFHEKWEENTDEYTYSGRVFVKSGGEEINAVSHFEGFWW